jgi:hypothetical protein
MNKNKTTRREFHRQVAALAAAPALAGGAAAQDAPRPPTAEQLLADLVRLRHGRHLNNEQVQRVRAAIASTQRLAERLRRVELQGGDEPAFAFSADVL